MKQKRNHILLSAMGLYLGAFAIPAGIMAWILYQRGFSPFGDKTLFVMDMKDQYLEFFASLRHVTGGDKSVFYCWSRSLGGNFLGLFAYYLASPFSWIVCLFPLEELNTAILLLTLLKIGLCGTCFALYADYLWRKKGARNFASCLVIWIFSACYAMSSYNMVYSMCLMWLDGVILLPVVLLGVERLLEGKKGLLLTLALTALFLTSYYIGYMVGIFTGIYFLYRLLCGLQRDRLPAFLGRALCFAVCTFLALGFSAPLLMPAIRDLAQGKLAWGEEYRFTLEANFTFTEFLGKLRYGVYDSITDSGLPSVYCGTIVLVLAAFFLFCRRIQRRERIGAVLILAFLSAGFYYKGLNLAWHGFRAPGWFPYRYAFLFSFFLIYMAYRQVCVWGEAAEAGVGCFGRRIWLRRGVLAAFFLVTVLDIGGNGNVLIAGVEGQFGYVRLQSYKAFVERKKSLVEEIKRRDNGLYRVNASYEFSKNDAMLFGYNGMTHYSSTFNSAVNGLTYCMGMAQSAVWNSGYGATPLTDSLFAAAYRLSEGEEPDCYELLMREESGTAAYRNPLALPMVYAADAGALEPLPEWKENPFWNQNLLLNAAAGRQEDYFTELEYVYEELDTGWLYRLRAESADPLYLYMKPLKRGRADVYVNDIWRGNYFTTETTCCLYLGSYLPGQEITVRVERTWEEEAANALIVELDMNLLRRTLRELQDGGMEITDHGGGKIRGVLSLQEAGPVLTSIPYDDGWEIWVDGERAEPKMFAGTFLALEVPAGEHEIFFSYISRKFRKGIAVFLITAVAAWLYFRRQTALRRCLLTLPEN